MSMRSPLLTLTLSLALTSMSLNVPSPFTLTSLSRSRATRTTSNIVDTNERATLSSSFFLSASTRASSCTVIMFMGGSVIAIVS